MPKEPKSTFTIGAICEMLPTTFCIFVTVDRMPSIPPMRSTRPLISVRFAILVRLLSEKPFLGGAADVSGSCGGARTGSRLGACVCEM